MKILHITPADPAGVAIYNSQALMTHYPEIEVRVIRAHTNYIQYPVDLTGSDLNIREWIEWADLLHIHESGFYMMGYIPDKPVLMHFHNRHYGWHFDQWRKLCDENNYKSVVSTPNLTLLNNDLWLPSPRPDYRSLRRQPKTFTVCQAPTNRTVKATAEVIKAFTELNLQYDIIERVNHKEALRRKANTSLMVDQFELGYGLNTIEAWSMRLPVIAGADPDILERTKELVGYVPFYATSLPQLKETLARFRDDSALYNEYQNLGHQTWREFHSFEAVADKTLEIYEEVLQTKIKAVKRLPQIAVSVIVPCFGYSQYLPDLVQCLDRQTFDDWEAVIVNDADPDFAIPKWISQHPKVSIVFLSENQGVAGAINRGIEKAKGEYITVLSADDLMRVDRLQELYTLAQDNPHRFIFDDLTIFGPGRARIKGTTQKDDDFILPLPEYDFAKILHKNGIHAGSMYPFAAWQQSGGYPEIAREGREDHAYNVAMGLKGWCGVRLAKPLYLYRRHSANRTNFDSNAEWHQIYKTRMQELYPDLYEGKLPMGCCGGKKAKSNNNINTRGVSAMSDNLPGSMAGFSKIEYIGTSAGDQSWWVGQTRYYLGGKRKVGFVANEDLPAMLKMTDGGRNVFRQYSAPAEPEFLFDGVEPQDAAPDQIIDPGSYTVTELKDLAPSLTIDDLKLLLANERADKNRVSLVTALESQLELA